MAPMRTAGIVIIGDEILSGRTADTNTQTIARWLGDLAIYVREVRVVPDVEQKIVQAINVLRQDFDYVFTTGGIGPTHDDITAEAVAAAFGVPLEVNQVAFALLEKHYGAGQFTPARQRMARAPRGASLIENPTSRAPGIRMGNVFVLPGVPAILRSMLPGLAPVLTGGPRLHTRTVSARVLESNVAAYLAELQDRFEGLSIGSYPFLRPGQNGVSVVFRSIDRASIDAAAEALIAHYSEHDVEIYPDLD